METGTKKNLTVNCIDIWVEGHPNPLRLESLTAEGGTRWWVHEEYFVTDVCGYEHIDFVGTYTECLEVMNEYLNMEAQND